MSNTVDGADVNRMIRRWHARQPDCLNWPPDASELGQTILEYVQDQRPQRIDESPCPVYYCILEAGHQPPCLPEGQGV